MTEPTQPVPLATPPPPDAVPAPAPAPPAAQALPPAPPPPPPGAGGPPPGYGAPPPGPRPPIYPMVTTFDQTVTMNRLWGIPLLGIMVRWFLLIPHFVILAFYGFAVVLLQLVIWIPVLLNGRYPAWGYAFVGGYVRWITRVGAYTILAAAAYPPFSTDAHHDVSVEWDPNQRIPRWAGIPLLGAWFRGLLLIPHWIVIYLLGVAVGFLSLITWLPVLLNGRYAEWAYRIVGGYFRWYNRLLCYVLLMTGPYPPFSLDD